MFVFFMFFVREAGLQRPQRMKRLHFKFTVVYNDLFVDSDVVCTLWSILLSRRVYNLDYNI